MRPRATTCYLETEVLTARPEKLQLMLIETAIRSIQSTLEHWRASRNEEAFDALIRAQRVITELLGGLKRDLEPDLTKRVAAVYLFVFRSLVEAGSNRDHEKLEGALKVLKVERETWSQLCRALAAGAGTARKVVAAEARPPDRVAGCETPLVPPPPKESGLLGESSTGLWLEA